MSVGEPRQVVVVVPSACEACCTTQGDDAQRGDTIRNVDPSPPAGRPLTTHEIETGQASLAEASPAALEELLQDLNRRKDYAFACHAGGGSPEAEYLWKWVQRVGEELTLRGYELDTIGRLYDDAGREVAVR